MRPSKARPTLLAQSQAFGNAPTPARDLAMAMYEGAMGNTDPTRLIDRQAPGPGRRGGAAHRPAHCATFTTPFGTAHLRVTEEHLVAMRKIGIQGFDTTIKRRLRSRLA